MVCFADIIVLQGSVATYAKYSGIFDIHLGLTTNLPRNLPVNFYRAMLCIRGTSHGPVSVRLSVCLSVRPSQVGVLLKRLNVGSHKQHHTIAQGL